jgi:hypothetical protein
MCWYRKTNILFPSPLFKFLQAAIFHTPELHSLLISLLKRVGRKICKEKRFGLSEERRNFFSVILNVAFVADQTTPTVEFGVKAWKTLMWTRIDLNTITRLLILNYKCVICTHEETSFLPETI